MKRIPILLAALGGALWSQPTTPELEGYRLRTPRSAFPRDLPCTSVPYGWACKPTDSLSLRFQNDTLFYIGYSILFVREDCPPPLNEWRARLNTWSRGRFGVADSVRMAPSTKSSSQDLTAYWSAGSWNAQAAIMTMGPLGRGSLSCAYVFTVSLYCGAKAWDPCP